MMVTMQATAFTAASPSALAIAAPPPELPSPPGASRGISISSTTTARSWSSRTANVARPCLDPDSPRSWRTCIATAVEERARPPFFFFFRVCEEEEVGKKEEKFVLQHSQKKKKKRNSKLK